MQFNYSSKKRTTEYYNGAVHRKTKLKSRQFTLKTGLTKRLYSGVDWGGILLLIAEILLMVADKALGSGKCRSRLLPELVTK